MVTVAAVVGNTATANQFVDPDWVHEQQTDTLCGTVGWDTVAVVLMLALAVGGVVRQLDLNEAPHMFPLNFIGKYCREICRGPKFDIAQSRRLTTMVVEFRFR